MLSVVKESPLRLQPVQAARDQTASAPRHSRQCPSTDRWLIWTFTLGVPWPELLSGDAPIPAH